MRPFRFVIRSLRHYAGQNLVLASGVAISTAVLSGALIIGDSVRESLERNVTYRLGKAGYLVHAGDRYLSAALAAALERDPGTRCIPLLQTAGLAVADGGRSREDNMQVLGIDSAFNLLGGTGTFYSGLSGNQVIINQQTAQRLQLGKGDAFLLRVRASGLIPGNTPLVSDGETTVPARVQVAAVAGTGQLGRFDLRHSQTAPATVFMNLSYLNRLLETDEKINRILIIPGVNAGPDKISSDLAKQWKPVDAGLKTRHIAAANQLELYSERVFIEPVISQVFENHPALDRFVLTYFVNAIRKNDRETPYSFVSTLHGELSRDEVIVNRWLADDLGIRTGDTLSLDYFVVGPLRSLKEETIRLKVIRIIPVDNEYGGRDLMPFLPGLSDAGHCRDWQAGIPIDLEKIRDKDERYWNDYKGTPKAFIARELGERIWQNRFGTYTAIRFDADRIDETQLEEFFRGKLAPHQIGIRVSDIRSEAVTAARSGVDFGQLFAGLSFFVLVSALLLISMLFLLSIEKRMPQAGTLDALGFSRKLTGKLFLAEAVAVSFLGTLAGMFLALLYNRFILLLLNRLWYDIVRTSILELSIRPLTLVTGFLASFVLGLAVMAVSLNSRLRRRIVDIQRDRMPGKGNVPIKILLCAGMILILTAAGMIAYMSAAGSTTSGFFVSGSLVLLSLLLVSPYLISAPRAQKNHLSRIFHLSLRNIARNPRRSYTIISLFALGTFVIVATGSNRKDLSRGAGDQASGTGGFSYFAESTVPVLHDLNDPGKAGEYGLEGRYDFVQLRKAPGDDASCLNLNRISTPAVLGVDPSRLEGRFRFVSGSDELDESRPWQTLNRRLPGGVVPAIADQTVIQWGLGKRVGDTLYGTDSQGDTLRLKLVGGLAASVFQGYVIISERHFLKHFPASSGSSVFLISTPGEGPHAEEDLRHVFRDFGWNMSTTTGRLAGFYSVENTYLSIFLMLGILSLVLGTIGLGILLARGIMERGQEIGLLQALGFSRKAINSMIFTEYLVLLVSGILAGFLPAVIATYPSLSSANTEVSLGNLAFILLLLLLNALSWIGLFTRFAAGRNLVTQLRHE